MKPSRNQIEELRSRISEARRKTGLTNAEIGRLSEVHPSQVGRICDGKFKTFSNNVVQVCRTLNVELPQLELPLSYGGVEWAQAESSMRKLWDETPEGAKAIMRMLNAIAAVQPKNENTP